MIRGFGGAVNVDGAAYSASRAGNHLRGQEVRIPGDISSAAFFLVAAAMIPGSDVTVRNVGCNPTRDGVVEILRAHGRGNRACAMNASRRGERVVDIHVTGGHLAAASMSAPNWWRAPSTNIRFWRSPARLPRG